MTGIYTATKGSVCALFLYDGSCHGGYSTHAFDELQNALAATCTTAVPIAPAHAAHAGYLSDLAGSSATQAGPCNDLRVENRIKNFTASANAEAAKPAGPGKPDYFAFSDALRMNVVAAAADAHYWDDGYHACKRPQRPEAGY